MEEELDFNRLFGGSIMSPVPAPYRVFARLRAERPVLRMKGWMEDSHLVTRYDDVVTALKDPETFSSSVRSNSSVHFALPSATRAKASTMIASLIVLAVRTCSSPFKL